MKNTISNEDLFFLNQAIKEAEKALLHNEVPIGTVIVKNKKIVARAYNQVEKRKNSAAHAEMKALDKAQKKEGDWRLIGHTLYTTLEPCIMCIGAILHARIDRVVFGALDHKWGGVYTKAFLTQPGLFNHSIKTTYQPYSKCAVLLKEFFKEKRKNVKNT